MMAQTEVTHAKPSILKDNVFVILWEFFYNSLFELYYIILIETNTIIIKSGKIYIIRYLITTILNRVREVKNKLELFPSSLRRVYMCTKFKCRFLSHDWWEGRFRCYEHYSPTFIENDSTQVAGRSSHFAWNAENECKILHLRVHNVQSNPNHP